MDTRYYLAVDIGASSGRHMLSHMENGKMVLEEIYRFPNDMTEKAGHKVWVVDRLFEEILTGMKKCLEMGKILHSMGIDTWAVDFVLLDENDKMLGDGMFAAGEDFDLTFGLMHTAEKSAEILVKMLSMRPDKLQTITPDNFRHLAKDFNVTLPEEFLYDK